MALRSVSSVLVLGVAAVGLAFGCGEDSKGGAHSGESGAGGANDAGASNGGSAGAGVAGGAGAGEGGSADAGNGGAGNAGASGSDAGASGAGNGGAGGEAGASADTHDGRLRGLGFDTDLGPPTDAGGDPLPNGYNPLRKKFSAFRPRAELYVAGLLWPNGTNPAKKEVLFDDKTGAVSYQPLPFKSPIDDTWSTALYKNGIAADLDGDGLDEFFITYYVPATSHLEYIILDPGGSSFRTGTVDAAAPNPTSPLVVQQWAQPALARGDFAGTGRDQIAVGFLGLYVLSVAEDGTVSSSKRSLDEPSGAFRAGLNSVFVAGGDLDGDANDELAVTYSTNPVTQGRVRIYDGAKIVRDAQLSFPDPEPGWGARNAAQAQVAIGDMDGDHLGEVVFFGRTEGDHWQVFMMDDLVRKPPPAEAWVSFHYEQGVSGDIPHPFALLDFNGDGRKDIFAQFRVLDLSAGTQTASGIATSLNTDVFPGRIGAPYERPRVTVGDLDADGKDDIVAEGDYMIRVFGLNALQVPVEKINWTHGEHTGGGWYSPILAAGNIDGDSPVVEFDGDHELLFTEPNIVAVVSSPPYFDGVEQDIESTTSTFGILTGKDMETEEDVGFSVGWSIGTKSNFLFGEAESKLEVEQSFDFTSFNSTSVERSLSYTTAPGKDLVVFTAIPFDVYYYTIRSSSEASEVGTKITINIPRKPQTIASDPEFFNARTGPNGPKVDGRTLKHTLGDPFSYPTEADRDALTSAPGGAVGLLATVTESGSATSTLQLSKTKGSGTSMNLDVTFSWEVSGASGPSVGGSVGFHYGYSYRVSTTDATLFEGTVGSIPAEHFSDHLYSYGLMTYPTSIDGKRFVMLDYWVE